MGMSDARRSALRWLGRFTFSLLILAALVGWRGYEIVIGRRLTPSWHGWLYIAGAAALASLAMAGLRERHRPRDHETDDER